MDWFSSIYVERNWIDIDSANEGFLLNESNLFTLGIRFVRIRTHTFLSSLNEKP